MTILVRTLNSEVTPSRASYDGIVQMFDADRLYQDRRSGDPLRMDAVCC